MAIKSYVPTLTLVLLIVLTLAATELVLEARAYNRGWNTLVFGMRAPTPSAGSGGPAAIAPQEGFGPTGDFPFRSRIAVRQKTEDVQRIWVASSSYGEDVFVPSERIFPNLIPGALARSGRPSVQVLNASKAGLTVDDNTRLIEAEGARWYVDLYVLYQMSNDIGQLSKYPTSRANSSPTDGPPPREGAPSTGALAWVTRLLENTTVYQNLKSLFAPLINGSKRLSDRIDPVAVSSFEGRVERFVDAAHAAGGKAVLCTFAVSDLDVAGGAPPLDVAMSVLKFNDQLSYRGWQDAVRSFNDTIRRVAERRNVVLIDVAEAMSGHREYFRDFFHFSEKGHSHLADVVGSNEALVSALAKQQ